MTEITIGGSEAAAAVGLNPYESPVQLWARKTGRIPAPEENERMRWGTLLQPLIAEQVQTRGYVTMPAPADAIHSEAQPWMTGHPDGYCGEAGRLQTRGVLEIKTCSPFVKGWDDEGSPPAYVIQCQHYLHLTGLEWALLACLVGGQRLELRRIERDEKLIEMMIEAEAEFVRLVETDTPPPPDGSKATDDVLKLLYPRAVEGQVVQLTAEDAEAIRELKTLKEAAKATAKQIDLREQQIKMRLGDAEIGLLDGQPAVTWKTTERKAYTVEASRYRSFRLS
jgi:putative phage-type endonuclease